MSAKCRQFPIAGAVKYNNPAQEYPDGRQEKEILEHVSGTQLKIDDVVYKLPTTSSHISLTRCYQDQQDFLQIESQFKTVSERDIYCSLGYQGLDLINNLIDRELPRAHEILNSINYRRCKLLLVSIAIPIHLNYDKSRGRSIN